MQKIRYAININIKESISSTGQLNRAGPFAIRTQRKEFRDVYGGIIRERGVALTCGSCNFEDSLGLIGIVLPFLASDRLKPILLIGSIRVHNTTFGSYLLPYRNCHNGGFAIKEPTLLVPHLQCFNFSSRSGSRLNLPSRWVRMIHCQIPQLRRSNFNPYQSLTQKVRLKEEYPLKISRTLPLKARLRMCAWIVRKHISLRES
jgi:hypothetical protein